MRVFVETSAINWLADWPEDAERFYTFWKEGSFTPVVAIEVANEVRRTTNAARLTQLEAVLRRFFPLAATYLPRAGVARLGMAICAGPAPAQTFVDLSFLQHGMDRTHLVNAQGHRCDIFLTRDAEMLQGKVTDIEKLLGVTRVFHPPSFLDELANEENEGRIRSQC